MAKRATSDRATSDNGMPCVSENFARGMTISYDFAQPHFGNLGEIFVTSQLS
jgi:hypothetical protein